MGKRKVRIELNPAGIVDFLKRSDVQRLVAERADEIKTRAERNSIDPRAEYRAQSWIGKDRARTHVATRNPEAMKAEARERALTRAAHAFDRGRAR